MCRLVLLRVLKPKIIAARVVAVPVRGYQSI